jgi:putative Ca2+/H+ antiporter (TMEM165/GDT1 family)
MLTTLLSTFGIIFVAELPDKTALATLLLATRFRVRDVVAGAWLAFLAQTVIAVAAGSVLHLLPSKPVHVVAGLGFFVFAALALRRDESSELADEAAEEARLERRARRLPPWSVCFLVVFAAELGDLTQLATAALVARSHEPLAVAAGALLALWTVTVIAALAGSQTSRFLSPVVLNRVAAGLFVVAGAAFVITAFL